ncbi:hypothetical protein J6590_046393 [Homalodisca vitripennis]|nr:hypothetical protein J6590_046393 [Homalodisca vitripennis]
MLFIAQSWRGGTNQSLPTADSHGKEELISLCPQQVLEDRNNYTSKYVQRKFTYNTEAVSTYNLQSPYQTEAGVAAQSLTESVLELQYWCVG